LNARFKLRNLKSAFGNLKYEGVTMSKRTFWSRLFSAKSPGTHSRAATFRPRLENLEDRTVLSATLLFDASAGNLSIFGDAADTTIRQTINGAGFLEVAVDGQTHSSDPMSGFFDQAMAGASGSTLASILFEAGSGHDTLILGPETLAHSFTISAAGADVITQDLTVAGDFSLQAQRISVDGAVHANSIGLTVSGWVTIEAIGSLAANHMDVSAGVFVNSGQLHADGLNGGQIIVSAGNVLNAGQITADASGAGGTVQITFTGSYIDTSAAVTSANGGKRASSEPGVSAPGGILTIDGGATGHLFSSGTFHATGSVGGRIDLFGQDIELVAATIDASGDSGGGTIHIGGDNVGQGSNLPGNAQTVTVMASTALHADATAAGPGGQVIVSSDQNTQFGGSLSARGGSAGGDGGSIEVSSKGNLNFGGVADTGAPAGKAGTLLLAAKNVADDAMAAGMPQFSFIDPHPTAGANFGQFVDFLSTGNVVVANPTDNFGGTNAGAVYLFNGLTGALISALVGSSDNDQVGSGGITDLGNGNFVVDSYHWNGERGAVTWGSGTAGISGAVSASNSLVGTSEDDQVGSSGVTSLGNGNYVIRSQSWNGDRGAATWGSGTAGVTGAVSAANSLIGANPNDEVGGSGDITLLGNGNYLIVTPTWNDSRGAVTWANGATGISGAVSQANSLVGTNPGDRVGSGGVALLSNGNYVVLSEAWNSARGAATWGNGFAGVTGAVSAANSLVGSSPNDLVGGSPGGVAVLNNGNYVVNSPNWNGMRGAATWGNGSTGVIGTISQGNSLVGSNENDQVGCSVTALSTGNYVVSSPFWNGMRGAATWADGTLGVTGTISIGNSLVGTALGDFVGYFSTALSNGNYVVASPYWNGNRGAATWGDGMAGATGAVSAGNSLVGSSANDQVASFQIAPLDNGNYVVSSPHWNGNRGAVTWGSGASGVTGAVSADNSLVGTLSSSDNSSGDQLGQGGVTALSNGNYVVSSPSWNISRGAVTWADGAMGITGPVSLSNTLVGADPNDQVGGSSGGVTALSNGNYVVSSPSWNLSRGAVTWGDGAMGISGLITQANSLVGADPNDQVGGSSGGVTALSNGNYVITSPLWNDTRGAATWANGTTGITGVVSANNSLIGSSANDQVGSEGIFRLSDGNYAVISPSWNDSRGAVTWASGTSGQTMDGAATITSQNSLMGPSPGSELLWVREDPVHHAIVAAFADESGVRIAVGLTDSSQLEDAQAQPATTTPAMLNTGGFVVLQASNDITINSPITVSADGALTLQAGRSILINASITTNNADLTLIANQPPGNGVDDTQRDPGSAVISVARGVTLNAGTGALTTKLLDGAGKEIPDPVFAQAATFNSNVAANAPATSYQDNLWISDAASNQSLTIGSGNYTGMAWLYLPANATTNIYQKDDGVSDAGSEYLTAYLGPADRTPPAFVFQTQSSIAPFAVQQVYADYFGPAPVPGWYFVWWEHNSANGTNRISVNNTAINSANVAPGVNVTTTPFEIGGSSGDQISHLSKVGFSTQILTPLERYLFWNPQAHATGTLKANTTWVTDSPSNGWGQTTSVSCDGSASTGVSLANPISLTNDGSTISIWFKTNASVGNGLTLFGKTNGNAAILFSTATNLQVADDTGTTVANFTTPIFNDNAWHNVIVVRTADNLVHAYFDGTESVSGGQATNGNACTFDEIGIYNDGTGGVNWNGRLAIAQALPDVATALDRTQLASAKGSSTLCMFDMRFSEGSGTTAADVGRGVANGIGLYYSQMTSDMQALWTSWWDLQEVGTNAVDSRPAGNTLSAGAAVFHPSANAQLSTQTNVESGAITLQSITAGTLSVMNNGPSAGSDIILGNVTTSGAQTYSSPNGTTMVTGNLTTTDSPVTFSNSVVLNAGFTISVGSSTVTIAGSTFTPNPGVLTINGGLALASSSTLSAVLNGTDPASYSQVTASGPIDLSGSTLTLTLGFTPNVGDSFTLLTAGDGSSIAGTFARLDEGAAFGEGGFTFQITYHGGPNNNSVVVTRVS
jgi:hypothetical protein